MSDFLKMLDRAEKAIREKTNLDLWVASMQELELEMVNLEKQILASGAQPPPRPKQRQWDPDAKFDLDASLIATLEHVKTLGRILTGKPQAAATTVAKISTPPEMAPTVAQVLAAAIKSPPTLTRADYEKMTFTQRAIAVKSGKAIPAPAVGKYTALALAEKSRAKK